MSSKKLISRIYIYIYIRNRWYCELINYGNISLNYSICWIRVYIYMVFCIFNGIFYSMKNEYQQNQQLHINIFIKEGIITGIIGLLEYSICWFHVYIYRFSAPSMDYWLLYPTKNELLTFQLMNLGDLVELHILSMKPHKNCFIKKWISLEYSTCWFMYIYRFSASSMDYWLLYPTKNDFLTFQLVNLGDLVELHILSSNHIRIVSSKSEYHWYHWSVGIFYLLV